MIRSKTIQLVHNAWLAYQQGRDPGVVLQELMVLCLAEQEQDIYYYLCNLKNAASSDEIAARFGWKINHASSILKRLHELGLVEREEVTNENGKRFLYWVKG